MEIRIVYSKQSVFQMTLANSSRKISKLLPYKLRFHGVKYMSVIDIGTEFLAAFLIFASFNTCAIGTTPCLTFLLIIS